MVSGKMFSNVMKIVFGGISGKSINWVSDTIKVLLLKDTYTPSELHTVLSDVEENEVTGAGYTSGGKNITTGTKQIVTSPRTNGTYLNIPTATLVWANSTIPNARYAIIYDESIVDGNDSPYLIGYIDFGENVSSQASDFSIAWTVDELGVKDKYNIFKIASI